MLADVLVVVGEAGRGVAASCGAVVRECRRAAVVVEAGRRVAASSGAVVRGCRRAAVVVEVGYCNAASGADHLDGLTTICRRPSVASVGRASNSRAVSVSYSRVE